MTDDLLDIDVFPNELLHQVDLVTSSFVNRDSMLSIWVAAW